MDEYEQQLLEGWEEAFKKGQLTLWITLALRDSPKHMANIKSFIDQATNGALEVDDKSIYRALRRYYDVEMIDYTQQPGLGGPDRKVYSLTDLGERVLQRFIDRNIVDVFFKPDIQALLKKKGSYYDL